MPKVLALGGFSGGTVANNTTFSGNVVIQGTLDVTGVATFTTTVTGSGNIMAGAAFALGFTGRSQIKSAADGTLNLYAADGSTALSLLAFGTASGIGQSAAAIIGLYGASTSVGSSLAMASDKQITWSSTTDPDGSVTVGLNEQGTNTLVVNRGSVITGSGAPGSLTVNALRTYNTLNNNSTLYNQNSTTDTITQVSTHGGTVMLSLKQDETGIPLVLGANAGLASPVARFIRGEGSRGGTDTNTAGAALTVEPGPGTGTASGGNVRIRSYKPGATGTTANTAIDRFIVAGKPIALTDNTATSLFEIALPTLAMCGGRIVATIRVTDGTDMQSFTQTIDFAAVNKGGVYTKSITATAGDKAVSAGTLTATWTLLDGSDKLTVQLAADTSLTPSGTNSFVVYYTIFSNCEQAITTL